jgi:hypothetical protein
LILFCNAATKDRSARSVGAFHRSSPVSLLLLFISTDSVRGVDSLGSLDFEKLRIKRLWDEHQYE